MFYSMHVSRGPRQQVGDVPAAAAHDALVAACGGKQQRGAHALAHQVCCEAHPCAADAERLYVRDAWSRQQWSLHILYDTVWIADHMTSILMRKHSLISVALRMQVNYRLALPHVSVPSIAWLDWEALHRAGFKGCVFEKAHDGPDT